MANTAYQIKATYPEGGMRLLDNSAETLGEAHQRAYPTRAAAQEVADRLAATLADHPTLNPSTQYTVEEVDMPDRRSTIIATLRRYNDGTGDLGVIVDQALIDDPAVTIEEVEEIVREARADAAVEI